MFHWFSNVTKSKIEMHKIPELRGEILNPTGAGGRRHPRGAGGIKLPPSTSHAISPQRVNVETRNFAHTYLNT